jgi:hypothetical protein
MESFRKIFCRAEGFEHIYRFITGLIFLVLSTTQFSYGEGRDRICYDCFSALWELPWNRPQKPLVCPDKSLKTLGVVLNPVSFSRQFPKSLFLWKRSDRYIDEAEFGRNFMSISTTGWIEWWNT